MFEEGRGLRVPRSNGPKVQESQGPGVPRSKGLRYLKLTFKYELDSKEGPSCYWLCKGGFKDDDGSKGGGEDDGSEEGADEDFVGSDEDSGGSDEDDGVSDEDGDKIEWLVFSRLGCSALWQILVII